jgi:hypothetical protein
VPAYPVPLDIPLSGFINYHGTVTARVEVADVNVAVVPTGTPITDA